MSTGAYYETLDTENGSNNCLHKKIIFIAYLGSKTNKNVVAMCAKENHKTFTVNYYYRFVYSHQVKYIIL